MKKNTIFQFLILVLFFGCQMEGEMEQNQSTRELLISGRSESKIKNFYATLPFEEQKLLWLDKFQQVKQASLEKHILKEMGIIIFQVEEASSSEELFNENFKNSIIALIKNLPQEDFTNIFSTLGDYVPSNINSGEYCINCLSYVELSWNSNAKVKSNDINAKKLPDCNCDWTCEDDLANCTTSSCEPTTTGCGFLWLGPCGMLDIIVC